jgi:hypothetical protein
VNRFLKKSRSQQRPLKGRLKRDDFGIAKEMPGYETRTFQQPAKDNILHSPLKAVFLHAAIERAATQSQGLGRLAHVTLKTLESFSNE